MNLLLAIHSEPSLGGTGTPAPLSGGEADSLCENAVNRIPCAVLDMSDVGAKRPPQVTMTALIIGYMKDRSAVPSRTRRG